MSIFSKTRLCTFNLIIVSIVLLFACSETEIIDPPVEDPQTMDIDPDKIVNINTNAIKGPMYSFWSTRPMVNQTRFNSANFRADIESIKPYTNNYNLVRMLGGRLDDKNTFYQGVDASGDIVTDFSGLITSMQNFMQTGFKPRIVLDNVPWEMSPPRLEDTYGNSKPPVDYNLWRQYINAFLQTLVDEFGMEEVKTWRFRVGTEPNFSPDHWRGTKNEYFRHYDITVDEVLQVIPDAIIGPGNLLTEGVATFTTELIDHCVTGTNYATGEQGTKMDFFSISYYEKIDQNTVKLPGVAESYRNKLNSYSQFSNIPFDIQEFGMLRDENGKRGISLADATELGASWYATIADMAYQYGITEIYDWGQEVEASSLPQGRKNVTSMLQMMEGGDRVEAATSSSGFVGAIPVVKDEKIYVLIYNHNPSRTSTSSRTLYPRIRGGEITDSKEWTMNEWTVDKTHGVFMHELYKDVIDAGVPVTNGRIYGNRPSDYFQEGWIDVLNSNLDKYQMLAELPQTVTDSLVEVSDENIALEIDLEPHSVKLIELTPK
jgi:xylan 1,4-beta-xylosidase